MKHIDNIAALFSKNFMESPVLDSYDAGKIHLSTGRLLACDPLLTNDMLPFETIFPEGDFPIVVHKEKDNHLIAYVEIILTQEVCKSWQMATIQGQNIKDLKKNEIFGFPVAYGMAAFMDAETQTDLNLLEENLFKEKGDAFQGIYQELFHAAFFKNNEMVTDFALVQPYPQKKNTIFAFATEENEGFYACYIGFDDQEQPVKIVMELIEIGVA